MRASRLLSIFAVAAGFAGAAWSQEGASWLRAQASASALNPNISVIGDFVGAAGPRGDEASNRLALREAEVGLQASVDPYARADFFVALHEGESAELEEGFITLVALPWGLQARGGKFLANFGRLNMTHTHELPQATRPLALESFLGEEGLNDAGVEVSRVFGPFGLFTELSYGLLNGLGDGHAHGDEDEGTVFIQALDETGAVVLDANGNPVYKEVSLHEEEPRRPRTIRNFAHVGRLRFYHDLTDAANLDVGFSGALHEPELSEGRKMAGVDLTLRWKPLDRAIYRSFIWRTEAVYSSRSLEERTDVSGAVTAPARRLDRRGGYTYVELQPARRWRFGVRGDYVEDPEAKDEVFTLPDGSTRQVSRSVTREVSPYVTFTASEFQKFRLQYGRRHRPDGEDEDRGFFQWVVVLGPHGGHPF